MRAAHASRCGFEAMNRTLGAGAGGAPNGRVTRQCRPLPGRPKGREAMDAAPDVELNDAPRREAARILRGVLGPARDYCSGAGFAPGDCYLTAPTINIGVAPCLPAVGGSASLNHIMAYDRAEVGGAYLGQTNMVAVSSFCGPNGLLLGHDLLWVEAVPHALAPASALPVYDMAALERAAVALFGTAGAPRFPLMPGELVPCAYKIHAVEGEGVVWGALAVAIARDRRRHADLFMEALGGAQGRGLVADHELAGIVDRLVRSVRQVGGNLGVDYERIYVGVSQAAVPAGHAGCALTAVPYFKLARGAVPTADPADLAGLSLDAWLAGLGTA